MRALPQVRQGEHIRVFKVPWRQLSQFPLRLSLETPSLQNRHLYPCLKTHTFELDGCISVLALFLATPIKLLSLGLLALTKSRAQGCPGTPSQQPARGYLAPELVVLLLAG